MGTINIGRQAVARMSEAHSSVANRVGTLAAKKAVGSRHALLSRKVRKATSTTACNLCCCDLNTSSKQITARSRSDRAIRARLARVLIAGALLGMPGMLLGQTDEIQVYDAAIAEPGIFNLMIHMNSTPIGRTTPAYPGGIIANNSFQTTAEWAYGVTPWFEQGLYLPVTTPYSTNHGSTLDGFKIRELFVRPHADDHRLVYGVNFEFSVSHRYWETRTFTSEVRPIAGLHLKPWDFIFNPIVDTDYKGGVRNLQFNPATRVAYNLNDRWAVAAEEYAGFGTLQNFLPVSQQFHEVWAVMDHNSKIVNIEAGIGVGYTAGADRLTLKLMLSRDLNRKVLIQEPEAKPPQ